MTTQTCIKCQLEKPLNGFHYIKRSNKHDTRCRACVAEYIRNRYRADGGQASKRANRRWRDKGGAPREWSGKTILQKASAYEAVKRWRAKNKERHKTEARAGISMRRSFQFAHAWPAIVKHYGGTCLSCGSVKDICFDHVQPLSLGGQNQLVNGQPLCRACNVFKGQLQDRSRDWRPDKGQWIASLVEANPWLVLTAPAKRGWHLTTEGREARKKRKETPAQLVIP